MNIFTRLSGLRPTGDTADAIAAALDRAKQADAEAVSAVHAAKAARDGLLLDGSPEELDAAEQALKEARANAERTDALARQLPARLTAAQDREADAAVRARSKEYEAADAALAAWWDRQLPSLRKMAEDGKALWEAKEAANQAWIGAYRVAVARTPGQNGYTPQVPDRRRTGNLVQHLSDLVPQPGEDHRA